VDAKLVVDLDLLPGDPILGPPIFSSSNIRPTMSKTIAVDPDYQEDFVLEQDKTEEDHPTFKIGVLDVFVRTYLDDTHSTVEHMVDDVPVTDTVIHDKFLNFVRFGLRGWTNFKNFKGEDVPFVTEDKVFPRLGKRTVVSDECLRKLDIKWSFEIGLAIIGLNKVSRKNS
jgi:hypothetical protein